MIPLGMLALLIAHSWRIRGPQVTLAFFTCSYVFFAVKALWNMSRDPSELPFVVNVHWWTRNGKDWGTFLILRPAVRVSVAYVALVLTEWVASRFGSKRSRFFPFVGCAALGFAAIGVGVELLNRIDGVEWWRWKNEFHPGLASWFRVWLVWGAPAFMIALLPLVDVRWLWLLPAAGEIAFVAVFLAACAHGDAARKAFHLGLAGIAIAFLFVRRGPRLVPLRRPAA